VTRFFSALLGARQRDEGTEKNGRFLILDISHEMVAENCAAAQIKK